MKKEITFFVGCLVVFSAFAMLVTNAEVVSAGGTYQCGDPYGEGDTMFTACSEFAPELTCTDPGCLKICTAHCLDAQTACGWGPASLIECLDGCLDNYYSQC